MRILLIILLAFWLKEAEGSHFRGGSISAKYVKTVSSSTIQIELIYSFAWRLSYSSATFCDSTYLGSGSNVGVMIGPSYDINCIVGCAILNQTIANTQIMCSSYSAANQEDWMYGSASSLFNIPMTTNYQISFANAAWITLQQWGIYTSNPLQQNWQLILKLDTTNRTDIKTINTSPITQMFPMVHLGVGIQYPLMIPVFDYDMDIIRCRWSSWSKSECGDVCQAVPFGALDSDSCTLYIDTQYALPGWYAAAIQIEDFSTSTSTYAISSVPLQFLLVISNATLSCSATPSIVGEYPENACLAADIGVALNFKVIAQTNCNDPVTDIHVLGPVGSISTSISSYGASSTQWYSSVSWTPTTAQAGGNLICATAVVSAENLYSPVVCYTFLVNTTVPAPIQSTTTPRGILSSTFLAGVNGMMTFKVNFNVPIVVTTLAAYIHIVLATTGADYYIVDARNASIVNNYTLQFSIPVNSLATGSYYITFDYGVCMNNQYCKPISNQATSATFWPIRVTASITTAATTSTTGTTTTTTFPTITTTTSASTASSSTTSSTSTTTPTTTTTSTSTTSTTSTSTTTTTTTTSTTTSTTPTSLSASTTIFGKGVTVTTTLLGAQASTTTISSDNDPTTCCNLKSFMTLIFLFSIAMMAIHSLLLYFVAV